MGRVLAFAFLISLLALAAPSLALETANLRIVAPDADMITLWQAWNVPGWRKSVPSMFFLSTGRIYSPGGSEAERFETFKQVSSKNSMLYFKYYNGSVAEDAVPANSIYVVTLHKSSGDGVYAAARTIWVGGDAEINLTGIEWKRISEDFAGEALCPSFVKFGSSEWEIVHKGSKCKGNEGVSCIHPSLWKGRPDTVSAYCIRKKSAANSQPPSSEAVSQNEVTLDGKPFRGMLEIWSNVPIDGWEAVPVDEELSKWLMSYVGDADPSDIEEMIKPGTIYRKYITSYNGEMPPLPQGTFMVVGYQLKKGRESFIGEPAVTSEYVSVHAALARSFGNPIRVELNATKERRVQSPMADFCEPLPPNSTTSISKGFCTSSGIACGLPYAGKVLEACMPADPPRAKAQKIELEKGWNFISFNVFRNGYEEPYVLFNNCTNGGKPLNLFKLMSFKPVYVHFWLERPRPYMGYAIKADSPCVAILSGDIKIDSYTPEDVEKFNATFKPGWNLFSVPFPVSPYDALSSCGKNISFVFRLDRRPYEYSGGKFRRANLLVPGKGYFVFAAGKCNHGMPNMTWKVPVISIAYLPDDGSGNLNFSETGISMSMEEARSTVQNLTRKLERLLEAGSTYHGYKDLSATPSLDIIVLKNYTFTERLPRSEFILDESTGVRYPDYRKILEKIGICDWVDKKGVEQVWLWGYHHGDIVPAESDMAMGLVSRKFWNMDKDNDGVADYGDVSNSFRLDNLPVCNRTYVLFNYNYGRGIDTALEDQGHQIEAVLQFIDTGVWKRFSEPFGVYDGTTVNRCGNIHNPPNSQGEYDRSNPLSVPSDCEDWKFEGLGQVKFVNCSTWNRYYYGDAACRDDGGLSYMVWWMQNIPGKGNNLDYVFNKMRNWWDFIGDFDASLASGATFMKVLGIVN